MVTAIADEVSELMSRAITSAGIASSKFELQQVVNSGKSSNGVVDPHEIIL